MNGPAAQLGQRILDDIALARHIGVSVSAYDDSGLVLTAPLAANSNHHGTAFGGSLFSLAVLAAWGLLTLKLEERGVRGAIVVQKSEIDYLAPVTGDFIARAHAPDERELTQLVNLVKRRGRGRIRLTATIEQAGVSAVRFAGSFAVMRNGEET